MSSRAGAAAWGFARRSVSEQAAEALRQAIRTGDLPDPLPGEHDLARALGVSRPTISAALTLLASEGLVVIQKGRRSRISAQSKSRSSPRQPKVCIVCPVPREGGFLNEHPVLLEMHSLLAGRGIAWEQIVDAKLGASRPAAGLRQLVASRQHVCWVLFSAPEQTQRWFADAGLPTLVVGSCPPGLNLPSVDFNHSAVGWHAAGAIISRGHKKIGLMLPANAFPGDNACRLGFLRYAEQRGNGVVVTEIHAPENPSEYRRKLDRLLSAPDRPTALFTMRAPRTITLLTHVLKLGLRIPQDISIVSRDTHPLLEESLPELTRYSSTSLKLASRAVRIAANILAGRNVAARPALVTPSFVPGSTLVDLRR